MENETIVTETEPVQEPSVNAQPEEATKPRKACGFSLLLNKYFHHVDRGGSLHGEIIAGLIMFFLSICILFVNMQIVANSALGGNFIGSISTSPNDPGNIALATQFVATYIGSLIVAIVGTLVIGLVARLPFVQISTMGLGTSLLSLVSTSTGLTYYNMLFMCLIASVLYAVIAGVPFLHKAVFNAIPSGVRKVMPATIGLLVAFICFELAGVISTSSTVISYTSGLSLSTYSFGNVFTANSYVIGNAFAGIIIALVVLAVLRLLKIKGAYFYSFLAGTVLFFVINIIQMGGLDINANTGSQNSIFTFGRIWAIMGSQASQVTPLGDSYLTYLPDGFASVFSSFGYVFTKGTDFSACTGNTLVLVVSGVLTYLCTLVFDFDGTLQYANGKLGDVDLTSPEGTYLARVCNAGINVVAPFFGVGHVTASKAALTGIEDDAKSGLSTIVCSIGFIISMFLMVFPALFATITYGNMNAVSMNYWNYFAYGNGGFLYIIGGLQFTIAEAVVAVLGLSMLKSLKNIDWKNSEEVVPAILVLVIAVIFRNLALAVAVGCVAAVLLKLFSFRTGEEGLLKEFKNGFVPALKNVKVADWVICGVMLVVLVFQLL